MSAKSRKRIMTSAIPDMSVADVRGALAEIRKHAYNQTKERPLRIYEKLSNGMMMAEFCLMFELGHHSKRHNKAKKK